MRAGRIVALVIGSLVALFGLVLLLGAAVIGLALLVERDDGYFDITLDRIDSDSSAVATDDITFGSDPDDLDWLLDALDVDVRLRATSADGNEVFIGIARSAEVDAYLGGAEHDVVVEVDGDTPVLRRVEGRGRLAPPDQQDFWQASASGPGTQLIEWEATGGRFEVLVMNADASAGVLVDVEVGLRAGVLTPIAIALLIFGLLFALGGTALIVFGGVGLRTPPDVDRGEPTRPDAPTPPGQPDATRPDAPAPDTADDTGGETVGDTGDDSGSDTASDSPARSPGAGPTGPPGSPLPPPSARRNAGTRTPPSLATLSV